MFLGGRGIRSRALGLHYGSLGNDELMRLMASSDGPVRNGLHLAYPNIRRPHSRRVPLHLPNQALNPWKDTTGSIDRNSRG